MNTGPATSGVVGLKWLQRAATNLPPAWRAHFWVPRGCVPDTASLADAATSRKLGSSVKVQQLSPPSLKAPGTESKSPYPLFVADFEPGKVIGDVSMVATKEDIVAGDLQGLHTVSEPQNHWRLQRCRYRRQVPVSGTSALLAAPAGANYYHWLLESLPRLQLLDWAGFDVASFEHFLLNEQHLPFHEETLDLLRIPVAKRLWCSRSRLYQCEHLVVPFLPAHRWGFPSWVATFLRDRFLPAARPVAPGQRLFISRRRASRRKLLNEDELETLLRGAGFKAVCLEDLPFADQVGLFASASAIVAIHGAGLTNLVFASPGTHVIELVASSYINHCYQRVAQTLALNYQEVISQPRGKARKRSAEDDLCIPAADLRGAIQRAGL